MPRQKRDYSSTHFYKIVCKDLDIRDFYIGHTTDFTTRKTVISQYVIIQTVVIIIYRYTNSLETI